MSNIKNHQDVSICQWESSLCNGILRHLCTHLLKLVLKSLTSPHPLSESQAAAICAKYLPLLLWILWLLIVATEIAVKSFFCVTFGENKNDIQYSHVTWPLSCDFTLQACASTGASRPTCVLLTCSRGAAQILTQVRHFMKVILWLCLWTCARDMELYFMCQRPCADRNR